MSTYRNAADDRSLEVGEDGTLKIIPDSPASEIRAFALRPEDKYRVIADLTHDTVIPERFETPEEMADNDYTDEYLRVRVARAARALSIRAERADQEAKAEAEAAAKLDEEAEALYRARWGEGAVPWEMLVPKADWRNVARAARKLHAPNETPEAAR